MKIIEFITKIIKIIFDLIKSILTSSMIFILIAMILIFSSDYIMNNKIKLIMEIISFGLFGIYFMYETYTDIISKKYTTYKYIVFTDIVVLFGFATVCYLNYKHYINIDDLFTSKLRIGKAFIVISISELINRYLKNEKFLIENKEYEKR